MSSVFTGCEQSKIALSWLAMGNVLVLIIHFITSVLKIAAPGGARALLAETLLVKHQLLILNRPRRRAPNLTTWDRPRTGVGGLPDSAMGVTAGYS